MRRARDRGRDARAGLLTLLVLAAGVYLAFAKALPFGDPYEVTVTFTDAANVKPGSPVRIAGVDVGKVAGVEHPEDGGPAALVTLRVADDGRPLHRDARFAIRPRTFLEGNFFVDVRPGTPSAGELRDGAVVPVAQSETAVRIGDVLSTLRQDVRGDLQDLLAEVDAGLQGPGAKGLRRSMRHWEPAYRGTAVVADALRGVARDDLPRALAASASVFEGLDRDPAALRALVRDLRATAGALAGERQALGRAVREIPALLRTARPALGALNDALPDVRRLARDARPGVRATTPALRAGTPLAREARGLLSDGELGGLARDLRGAVPGLAAASGRLVGTVRELRPAAACLAHVVLPWSQDRIEDEAHPATGPVFQELPKAFGGIGGESRSGDANGQWLRVSQTGALFAYPQRGSFLLSSRPLGGVNPPPPEQEPPLRADVPCETQEPPDLRTRPASAPPGFRIATGTPGARDLLRRGLPATDRLLRGLLRDGRKRLRLEPAGRILQAADLRALRRGR